MFIRETYILSSLIMSRLVKSQRTYFQLLLAETSNKQKQALLDTITADQLRALVQIVVNFLQRVLSVPSSVIANLKRHKRLLRSLADTALAFKEKIKLLRGRAKVVNEFLRAVEPSLKNYLK